MLLEVLPSSSIEIHRDCGGRITTRTNLSAEKYCRAFFGVGYELDRAGCTGTC